jgi:thiol-disulfide isomerase/thioredoxin
VTFLTGRRGTALRWALVVALLVVAGAFALWPRGDQARPGSTLQDGQTPGVDLERLRQQAALAPCPASPAAPIAQASPAPASPALASPLVGVRVPCLGDGEPVDLGSALAGRPVLLNVWSHTCEPCREELPVLQRYVSEPGSVDVLGVQVDGSPQAGLALLTMLGVRLPSVSDPDATLRAALAAPPVLPLSYVVGRDGGVRMVNPPVVFHSPGEVGDTVRHYLAEAASP